MVATEGRDRLDEMIDRCDDFSLDSFYGADDNFNNYGDGILEKNSDNAGEKNCDNSGINGGSVNNSGSRNDNSFNSYNANTAKDNSIVNGDGKITKMFSTPRNLHEETRLSNNC